MPTEHSADFVRAALDYEPATGILTWRPRPVVSAMTDKTWNSRYAGKESGTITKGYRSICLANERYFAHRLAWVHYYGAWPTKILDHINGNGLDNRIANLRECTVPQNQHNRRGTKRRSDGDVGTKRSRDSSTWHARISVNGKRIHLGSFPTKEEASAAYQSARAILHPFASRAAR